MSFLNFSARKTRVCSHSGEPWSSSCLRRSIARRSCTMDLISGHSQLTGCTYRQTKHAGCAWTLGDGFATGRRAPRTAGWGRTLGSLTVLSAMPWMVPLGLLAVSCPEIPLACPLRARCPSARPLGCCPAPVPAEEGVGCCRLDAGVPSLRGRPRPFGLACLGTASGSRCGDGPLTGVAELALASLVWLWPRLQFLASLRASLRFFWAGAGDGLWASESAAPCVSCLSDL